MFYYAEIDSNYLVTNVYALNESSTNSNYISITEEQYTSGDLVGKYYNSLTGNFEKIDYIMDYIGTTNSVAYVAPQGETAMLLTTFLNNMQVEMDDKADVDHSHTGYASSDDLALLEDVVDTKANATHTHSEYATTSHAHDNYATVVSLDALSDEVNGKADSDHAHTEYAPSIHSHTEYASATHTHSNYAETTHTHDDYSSISHTHTASEIGAAVSGHNHDSDYSDINHNHDSAYASIGHDHDDDYAPIDHSHIEYATTTALTELSSTVSGKANASHTHDDRYYTETEVNTKLAEKADSSHTHTGVYDISGSAASALTSANAYTDSEIETLSETVATKANTSDLTSHTGNTTVHITSTERNNWNAAKTHANSAHAPSNAEENQNAFSNIVVNGTTIAADTKMDTLTLVAGNNVTIIPDATGDSITISSANTVYTHPTSAGNKHIPAGGSSGQILRWSADGTAVWGNDNNTTYSNATQSASGLMSDTDKTKLDGIAEGANKYVLPSAGTALGGVKSGGDVTISSGVITVNDDSHNHIISNVDGLQSALDSKAASGHDHNSVYYTETEVDTLLSGKANTNHTHTIANITNLQTTLDGKANTSHGTHVSYSTTAPVMDGTASVGTASTVARSDHKHPTDTSRAAQTSLDSHTSNKSNPHGVTLAQLGVTATAAELNKMDGVTATTTELNYVDGVTSNIQTQLNGKASSGHTHNYAGSSSAGGAATSANKLNTNAGDSNTPVYFANGVPVACTSLDLNTTGSAAKLTTARNIALGNDLTGSANFDGSGNITISAKHYNVGVNSGNKSNYPYHRIAYRGSKANPITSQYNDTDAIFSIRENYNGGGYGILKVSLRTNNSTTTSQASAVWLARNNFSLDDVKVGLYNVTGATYADIYLKVGTYARTTVSQIEGNRSWTLVASNEVNDTTTSDKKTSTECYVSIENAATTLHGQAYSSIISSVDGGQVAESARIGSSTVGGATQPVYINGGTPTACTYTLGKSVPSDAKFTDTTYNAATTSTAGLMSASDKSKLDNITASADSVSFAASATSGNKVGAITINGTTTNMYSPTQTSVSGNAGTATKLATARTISLTGDVTGSTSFDGSGNVSITATVADDSHNHTIANVDGLQTALNGKSATSHTHTAEALVQMAEALFGTNSAGGVEYSYGSGSGKNVLTEISNMPQGFHTIYSIAGTTGNPETTESYRYFIHKTSTTIGWIWAFGADGSIYSNYLAGANTYKGWKTIHDAKRKPLWTGSYYMTAGHTATPSKKLSECEHGWMLLWSDYDPDTSTVNNTDFCTTMIPNRNWTGGTWNGAAYYCDIPRYTAGTATDSESRIIKVLNVYDNKLVGTANNNAAPRNDVILRAVYEF